MNNTRDTLQYPAGISINGSANTPSPHGDEVWQESIPPLAWGTLALLIAVITGYVLVISAALGEQLPYPIAMLACAWLAYASFTVMHDAGHGSIVPSGSRLKFIESGIGWLASLPLLIAPYRLFQKIHDRHHAFTNDPERDPDHYAFGDKWYLVVLNSLFIPLQYHLMSVTRLRHLKVIRQTYLSSLLYLLLVSSAVLLAISQGYANEILYLFVLPAIIAVFFLAMFFDYIPHHPHKALGRYHNTRIFPGRIGNILLLGQNYHLIHHLYPRVPWYRYAEVYARILPELEARHAPIEKVFGGTKPAWLQSPNTRIVHDGANKLHHVARVTEIEHLTPDAVSIRFELPSAQALPYQAGQYITVSKWLAGQQHSRCYSLCSSPHKGEIRIAVRKTLNGRVSSYLNEQLSVGDELVLQGPGGDFVYPPAHSKAFEQLVLIAAGSGITPIKAILEAALEEAGCPAVSLIYVVRDRAHCMFLKQLEMLARTHSESFNLHLVFSADQAGTEDSGHAFNPDRLAGILNALPRNTASMDSDACEFYLCGPDGFKNMVLDSLTQAGAVADRIHVEQFNTLATEPQGVRHLVDISLADGQNHQLRVASNQTVLEVANAQGVVLPHACGSGTCGSCKMKVERGESVKIPAAIPGLTKEEREAGYTLACQCRPLDALSLSEP